MPPPPPPARGCAPLPSDRELASWSIDEICSPGSGPDPGDVRHVKDLPDGTHIVQNNGRCMRARYRECNTKCLPPDALIATPSGDVPIHDLRIGDEIWTRDPSGARVKTRVALVSRVEITGTHHIAQLVLADGRALAVSPEHPALDGQLVQSLRVGDTYDGASIVLLTLVSYAGARTHDVWPAGSTGVYWANGIPLTSTLRGI
ncbi:MAG: Hint domain-containing protein [Kofleriaceae bacterium]